MPGFVIPGALFVGYPLVPWFAVMALGYADWEAGQLEQELLDNAWLTAEASSRILFETPLEDRWTAAAALVGVDPRQLSMYAGHA